MSARSGSSTPIHGYNDRHEPVRSTRQLREPTNQPLPPVSEEEGRRVRDAASVSESSAEWDNYPFVEESDRDSESPTFSSLNNSIVTVNSDEGIDNANDTVVTEAPSQPSKMATGVPNRRAPSPFSRLGLPPEISNHVKTIKRAILAWTDDFDKLAPARLTTARLQVKLEKAEVYRENITDAIIELKGLTNDPADLSWVAEIEASTKTLRENYGEFIQTADSVLGVREHNEKSKDASAAAGITVKKARVVAYSDGLDKQMDELINVFKALDSAKPADEPAYAYHIETINDAKEKCTALTEDAKALVEDAAEAGLVDKATDLDAKMRALKAAQMETVTQLANKKEVFGIIGTTGNRVIDVPVPTFSGNPADTDFFTFSDNWTRYCGSKVMSETEKFSVLSQTSLTGQAKNVSSTCKTVAEVMTLLRKYYGNPWYLLNYRMGELRKVGGCSGGSTRRREWAVDVRARLLDLQTLAEDHDIAHKLHNSPIVSEIQSSFSHQMVKEFKRAVKAENEEGNLSSEQYFKVMMSYLDTLISTLTFDVNYELNLGYMKGPEQGRDKHGQKGESKKVFTTAPVQNVQPATPSPVPAAAAKKPAQKKGKKASKSNAVINSEATICATYKDPEKINCKVCRSVHKHAFSCPEFQKARGKERVHVASKMQVCFRCLRLDSFFDKKTKEVWWKMHEKNCVTDWACSIDNCPNAPPIKQYHITMCLFHQEQNKEKQAAFIKSMEKEDVPPNLEFFFNSAVYQLDALPDDQYVAGPDEERDILDPTIFMLQYVEHEGNQLLLFYDSGCGGAAISKKSSAILGSTVVREGPTLLNTAGGNQTTIPGGDERFKLRSDVTGKLVNIIGLRIDELTTPFPTWDLATAWSEIAKEIEGIGGASCDIPKLPKSIGGTPVDLMLGIRYIKLFPELLFFLPSGLAVYKSKFAAPGGETCVLGGPHPSWRRCRAEANYLGPHGFFTAEMKAYFFASYSLVHVYSPPKEDVQAQVVELVDEDDEEGEHDLTPAEIYSIMEFTEPPISPTNDIVMYSHTQNDTCEARHCDVHAGDDWLYPVDWPLAEVHTLREDTGKFFGAETVGSEIAYRCIKCRHCSDCKQAERLESASFKEENEQHLIESSVRYNASEKRLVSTLPFIAPPKDNLFPNRFMAQKVLDSQMKKVSASDDAKMDILESFEKLSSRGFLLPVSALDTSTKKLVYDDTDAGYYIPWRTVYKEASLSTPCRLVFDASSRTPGGTSLNEVLAKGENRLSNIHHVLLRFRNKASAFTCDIRMAYNMIALDPSHFKYQRFLWKNGLEENSPVEDWIISTLIYGVRPVGNSLIAGFKKVADYAREHFPEHRAGADALVGSAYVDDIAHADVTAEQSRATAESLDHVLGLAKMEVKGYTFSGQPPPPEVTADGETVGLIGMVWHPEDDWIGLSVKPLYFGRPKRGKLPDLVVGDYMPALKKNFTRRNLLSKVASVYDPMGLVTPLTARLKLDLHAVVELGLGWDDTVPEEHLDQWLRNINDIQKLRDIRFRRTIIPPDAVNTDVELVVSADASQFIAVAAVHGRVKRKNGEYSCSLMSAKSRLVSELTIPKGELRAAVLSVHLAHTVKQNLLDQYKDAIYITDSSIVLFWINTDTRPLNVTVRNAVIEIRRFTSTQQWFHIDTNNNIADLGTRTAEVEDIAANTDWQLGKPWMKVSKDEMPIKSLEETKVSQEEKRVAAQEIKNDNISGIFLPLLATKVSDRYDFTSYLSDPNKYSWLRSVRVMSYVLKFSRKIRRNWKPVWAPQPNPSQCITAVFVRGKPALQLHDLRFAENYYFRLATLEVMQFVSSKDRTEFDMRNGIYYYAGRILDGQEIHTPVDVMFDVSPLHYVKPVLDRYSPVAYAIMVHVHVNVVHHRGANPTYLSSKEIAHIIRGRSLAIEVRDACPACIRYRAKLTRVEMGKIHDTRLTIAPAFYQTQIDLMGPMIARCRHNHRSTVKIWTVVFKDPASTAVSAHVMQGYSTDEFLQAYTRFAARFGHPSRVFIDEGSQLKSAFTKMEISLTDVTTCLSTRYNTGLEFTTCPVAGHNVHGMVERSIQSIQKLFERTYKGLKLDALGFETAYSWICSQLNSLPICLGSRVKDLDNLEIITPNRLIMGRSSTRAIGGHVRFEPPSKMVSQMDDVYEVWWNLWKEEKIVDYVPQPSKWNKSNDDVREGDIVLILQNADEVKLGGPLWKIARIRSLETSHRDGLSRVAICEYKNPSESEFRTTRRSVRKIAVIHHEDELDLIPQLNEAAKKAGESYFLSALRSEQESWAGVDPGGRKGVSVGVLQAQPDRQRQPAGQPVGQSIDPCLAASCDPETAVK